MTHGKKTIRCERCKRRLRRSNAFSGWCERYVRGRVAGYVCPTCQTSLEHLEGEVNSAQPTFLINGKRYELLRSVFIPTAPKGGA
ncbi:hypothetical protein CPPEL_01785 [Corynebacterium pseudopelargi]|uniref:Uncharacterized protein n=1 Tax=Corynebacterium pseudopelargi TaxID=2080757 RepID=A0A3G6ISF8_9CORY|nr:hypothetical protein CPPEL_01785 [Corynebacterium pseudopelargi]